MDVTTIPFRMRGLNGEVTVEYGTNDYPVHWGYDALGTYAPELARGFPIVQARVSSYPAHGYAADMGWVQVVRYTVFDTDESVIVFDVPPQLSDTDTPYMPSACAPPCSMPRALLRCRTSPGTPTPSSCTRPMPS